jgi:hypothetical protein
MLKRSAWIGFCCLVVLNFSLAASARVIVRHGADLDETIDCRGHEVKIEGSSNHVVLTGVCPKLTVKGTKNVIEAEQVGSIRVTGAFNKVVWSQGLGARQPRVINEGENNRVISADLEARHEERRAEEGEGRGDDREQGAREERRGQAPDIDVSGNGLERELECHGENVKVSGNGNRVRLHGGCGRLSVEGNGNKCQVEAARAIAVSGNGNKVAWQHGVDGEEPRVTEEGNENEIHREPGRDR